MKIQKFKLQRKVIVESRDLIYDAMRRIRIATQEQVNYNPNDFYSFTLLNQYYYWLSQYLLELEKLLLIDGEFFLVSSDLMDRINEYKKKAYHSENLFTKNSVISLSVH
jgi:hypothetical protein